MSKKKTKHYKASDAELEILGWANQVQKNGFFKYNAGNNDLLVDILDGQALEEEHVDMLRRVLRQPTAMFCGTSVDASCCFAHIVRLLPKKDWATACEKLDAVLHDRLKAKISDEDMPPQMVLAHIEAEGKRVSPSQDWKNTFAWLQQVLAYTCDLDHSSNQPPSYDHGDVVEEVRAAARAFLEVHKFTLRPCQLAAILLNVYGVKTGTKLLMEMKTGEGKTYVCGVSAAVVARMFMKGPAVILTSSVDRANADRESTAMFINHYLKSEAINASKLSREAPIRRAPAR